jgi:hypothetical protein
MSFSVGIVGLPNVGKSTLFKALTKQQVDISNYPFCTIDPNVGVVAVPDKRLEQLAQIIKPEKITPTVIEFADIAGLVKNAHQGEGLGNQFLSQIRETDAICQVVRAFQNEKITHVDGEVEPKKDIETINFELIMKDLETVSKRIEKAKKQAKTSDKKTIQELEILSQIKQILDQNKLLSSQKQLIDNELTKQIIKELGLLTAKPMIYVFNINRQENLPAEKLPSLEASLLLDLKEEAELSELSEEEIQELELGPSQLDDLIKTAYRVLNLITFYTIVGGREVRAWTLKNNSPILEAAGTVHSDFEEKFIKAEVINWQKLIESNGWTQARQRGLIQTQGKDYIVQDGDVIEFKI